LIRYPEAAFAARKEKTLAEVSGLFSRKLTGARLVARGEKNY
jgi:hypothetical protein